MAEPEAPPHAPADSDVQPSALGRWRILHRLREFLHSLYAAGGILLLVGLTIAIVALWALAMLTREVLDGETLRLDESALRWLAGHTSPRLDGRALELTSLGGWTVVLTITVISAGILALLGRRYYAALLPVAVCGGWLLGAALKAFFGRERPQVVEWRTPHAGQTSFPSGHAMMGMVLYVTLAYVIHRIGNRRWVTALSIALAVVIVTLIGVTRVYLGVHYPSDVLAGYAVGFSWAMFCAAGVEMLRREKPAPDDDRKPATD